MAPVFLKGKLLSAERYATTNSASSFRSCQVSDKPEAVDHVIANMFKHTWYLDSTLVPLALLDSEVPNVEKREIADAILAIKMPHKERSFFSLMIRNCPAWLL